VFPPGKIRVSRNGEVFDEIHVDGGVSNQVFLFPVQIDLESAARRIGIEGQQVVYIIRNGYLSPRWGEVNLNMASILGSSLDTIIRTQGNGDLYRIYLGARHNGADFRLAFIPPEFEHPSSELFDPEFMTALFEYGYQQARNGYPWATSPPGIELK
jgi:hypothetical protein